ncbi:MAG: hypothetical protein WC455_20450 [Dehalococcoidia bacterium]|jgi:hypothetical protein
MNIDRTKNPPVEGMTVKPLGLPLMFDAWLGCMEWTISQKEFVDRFEKETGIVYRAPKCGLDAMIDDATGYHLKVLLSFFDWATKTLWGEDRE